MADIVNATSTYSSGTLDTASTLVDNVSPTAAKHINYPVGAIIQVETILGSGTTLKGSQADLATRLAVPLESNGKLKDFSSTTKTTFPPAVTEGCTGAASFTDGAVLLGNATSAIQALALPSSLRVLSHSGTAGTDPSWIAGLLYQGPTSCGSGSTQSHSSTLTVSSNGNYSGIYYCTDFTLNVSTTMTVPAAKRRIVIIANNSITINGTITASGAGGSSNGGSGTDQPGGGGAGDIATAGGVILRQGITWTQAAIGAAGTQVTGGDNLFDPFAMFGGSGGGMGGSSGGTSTGSGGIGGGSICLIAPAITLASTATLNTAATAGGDSFNPTGSGGGGGGAGNILIIAKTFTDNGCIFTQTGGAAGPNAGAGAAGVKQILIYG